MANRPSSSLPLHTNFNQCNYKPVDVVDDISAEDFRKNYYYPMRPLVIKESCKKLASLPEMELGLF
jgi:hypothetical protein